MLRTLAAIGLLMFARASGGAQERWATPDLGRKLVTGDWNERISAVNQLGERGQAAFPELRTALDDPDWQVRLSAVHWLARFGRPAAATLREAAEREECPLVRLTALNKLGRLGSRPPPPPRKEEGNGFAACKSWTWPLTESYIHARRKKSKRVEYTALDEKGCQYIRFRRSGRRICPEGFLLKGVGASPGEIKILKKDKQPQSGVALCCRAGRELAAEAVEPPKPQEVECRLHPMECPAPWVEMAPPDNNFWSAKERKFRRTRRMKLGAINWVHCCRPHQTGGTEYFPPSEESMVRAIPEKLPPVGPPSEELEDYREPADEMPYEDFDSMPEREIAERMLAKRAEETRSAPLPETAPAPDPGEVPAPPEPSEDESPAAHDSIGMDIRERAFESLLTAVERDLPPPQGLPENDREEYAAEAAHDRPARETADPGLDAPAEDLGAPERRLGAPAGLDARTAAEVRAPAEILEDGGKIVRHDPLPALLSSMRHESPLQRSRAADELGSLGSAAEKAVPALRRSARDESARVRASAALALGNITAGSDVALKDLKGLLKDGHVDVRYSAALALGRLGTPASRKAFDRHMRGETRRFLRAPSR